MSGQSHRVIIIGGAVLLLFLCICAGCTSTTVGNAWYENKSIRTTISHTGDPADAHVQVSIYRISSLSQEPYAVTGVPVSLSRGDNPVIVPGELPPGTYKLYIYVLGDNERKAAVIRDITV